MTKEVNMNSIEVRTRNVKTGARIPTPRMLVEADAAAQRAEEDETVLGDRFTVARRNDLLGLVARVRALYGVQSAGKAEVTRATDAVREAALAARALVGDVLAAARNAFGGEEPEVLASFRAGPAKYDTLGTLDAKMEALMMACAAEDAALAAWGEPDAAARLLAAQTDLRQANTAQDASVAHAPAQTEALYEAKGLLLAELQRLSRVAKRVFRGQPARRAAYALTPLYERRNGGAAAVAGDVPAPAAASPPPAPPQLPSAS
jgi:hypothetical protein